MTVYLSEYIHPDALRLLKENACVVDTFDEVEKIDAIILRAAQVTRDIIRRATNLKIIGKHGVGCNTIDLDAARELGVPVLNTPSANTNSVAELIVGLALSVCRHIPYAEAGCKKNEFPTIAPASLTGIELSGKILGMVGMGNIAQRTAHILGNGFDMRVIGYDPYISADAAKKLGFQKVENLAELIAGSDVVNVSVPLTKSTENLISGQLFDAFRKDAVLINAARGGVVNEQGLYDALKAGKLRAAACDAFVQEPPTSENPLLSLPNFVATPHIGATTEEALYRMGIEVVTEVINVLNGQEPKNRVA